jgi:glycosyltransferase involved in cell wall biosynthesis
VNWRLVLVGLVIGRQSEGHGVALSDLSTERGEAHVLLESGRIVNFLYMFKPSYLWPNPAFPFREYFTHEKLRIFIIENVPHNWEWLREYSMRIRTSDYFFIYCGWNHTEWFADQASKTLDSLHLDKKHFIYLFNSKHEMEVFASRGFHGVFVNQNAWIDELLVMKSMPTQKVYDAVYVGRRSAFKRHMLAAKVPNLAIVSGLNHGNDVAPIPDTVYVNSKPLLPDEVCEKINQSYCGLILSAEEGACFASSEYLLCGTPVVSTHSRGGRDAWYDDYNSIVCDPDPDQIAGAVAYFKANPRDPELIRANHVQEARRHRLRFIEAFERVLHQHGVRGLDVHRYFYENYFHKMRKSIKPDFETIFPPLS